MRPGQALELIKMLLVLMTAFQDCHFIHVIVYGYWLEHKRCQLSMLMLDTVFVLLLIYQNKLWITRKISTLLNYKTLNHLNGYCV
jgi:hypothetical protein